MGRAGQGWPAAQGFVSCPAQQLLPPSPHTQERWAPVPAARTHPRVNCSPVGMLLGNLACASFIWISLCLSLSCWPRRTSCQAQGPLERLGAPIASANVASSEGNKGGWGRLMTREGAA